LAINQSLSFTDLNFILKTKNVVKRCKKKPSGAEYRKRRVEELEFAESKKSMSLQKYFISKSTENETCNQGKASTSASPLNALLGEANTDDRHDEEEELGSQFDFTEVDNTQTPKTSMIILSNPALWPKIRDRKMMDHLILHGPKKVRFTYYP
jgi:hypothetical protein